MINVLYFIDRLGRGGAQAFLKSMCESIDKKVFNISILVLDDGKDYSDYEKEFENNGVKVLKLKSIWVRSFRDYLKYKKTIRNFFVKNHFDIVHVNSGPKNYAVAKFAYKNNIKVIYHSHNTGFQSKNKLHIFIGNYLKRKVKKYSHCYFACSELAALWMFGKKKYNSGSVNIINNALDVDKYKFNEINRLDIRKKLNIKPDDFVIGHVARFQPQKNHLFLLNVFKKLVSINSNYKLILIGDGDLQMECKEFVNKNNLTSNVFFLGVISDVYKYYSSFDCFVLTSLYEGLPVVSIEAQMNGVPCVFSNTITKELKINNNVLFMSIKDENDWIQLNYLNLKRINYDEVYNNFKDSQFNVKNEVKKLENVYISLLNNSR